MNEYKIYVIKSRSHPDLQYIGSTKNSLKYRLSNHLNNYKKYLNDKYHYVTSFDILKYNDYYVELYCNTGTDDKSDAHWFEGQIIRSETCVNKNVPSRTRKEYYETNKDRIKEYREQKYICECGGRFTIQNRAQHYKTKKHISFISFIS